MRSHLYVAILSAIFGIILGAVGSRLTGPSESADKGLLPRAPEQVNIVTLNGHEAAENRALAGSAIDSQAMMLAFDACMSGKVVIPNVSTDACIDTYHFWEHIDAENGGSLGVTSLFHDLVDSDKCFDARRAQFWAKRVEDSLQSHREAEAAEKIKTVCAE